MTANANYETEIDGVRLTVRIEASSTEQDPAVVRDFVDKLAQQLEEQLLHLEEGEG